MKSLIELAHSLNYPLPIAYWDWQHDGTHFCSECGTDALFNYEGEEFCSLWCPHCGCFMTEVRYE
jgi:hypothetical protein